MTPLMRSRLDKPFGVSSMWLLLIAQNRQGLYTPDISRAGGWSPAAVSGRGHYHALGCAGKLVQSRSGKTRLVEHALILRESISVASGGHVQHGERKRRGHRRGDPVLVGNK